MSWTRPDGAKQFTYRALFWVRGPTGRSMRAHPATCAWAGDRLEMSSPEDVGTPHSLRVEGDLLFETELPVDAATRFDTLDAAKASLL